MGKKPNNSHHMGASSHLVCSGLSNACSAGCLPLVKLLLEIPSVQKDSATKANGFKQACEKGHCDVVKHLLREPDVSPAADSNYALQSAAVKVQTPLVSFAQCSVRVI